jgi:hypothetical protein
MVRHADDLPAALSGVYRPFQNYRAVCRHVIKQLAAEGLAGCQHLSMFKMPKFRSMNPALGGIQKAGQACPEMYLFRVRHDVIF